MIFQEKLLKVLKCYNFLSAKTTQLLSSGEFWKLRYDNILVKSASANISFYSNNSKMPNFELWHSCRKWAICKLLATARGWQKFACRVVKMWAEFHAVYWEVHLQDTRLITHEIRNGNNCFKDSTIALFPRSLCLLSSRWHVIVCTGIKTRKTGLQSVHSFILHVKTVTCFGYTYVAIIRLDIETWIRKL
jgi:hypothetical protein